MIKFMILIIKIAFFPITLPFAFYKRKKSRKIKNKISPEWDYLFKKTIQDCNSLNTDFVEMTSHAGACKECAKYQGKIYSISGKSKKYPPLPDAVQKYGKMHPNCRHDFHPFIEGVSKPLYKK